MSSTATRSRPRAPRPALPRLSWNDAHVRSWLLQAGLLAAIVAIGWFLLNNAQTNMAARGLTLGFGFLDRPAGIPIGESMVEYTPANTYARALWVGLLNTLRVAIVGCILTTLLGVTLGIMRLSTNPLLARLVGGYIELIRNTPVVLQLVFWHAVILALPPVRQALNPLPGVFLSQRGLKLPSLAWDDRLWFVLAAIAVAIALCLWNLRREQARQAATGERRPLWWKNLALLVALPYGTALLVGAPLSPSVPQLRGFNFAGGLTLSPEFAAILVGLVIYTSAFVAEIVRSGIQSVSKGQWEAARSLGLPPGRIMRLVILPQALRVIIPPLTSQYLNLTKNSSLAVVIGYPDLVSIANTSINQTGQAIEVITIFMTVYLILSLLTSALMNWYNARIALKER